MFSLLRERGWREEPLPHVKPLGEVSGSAASKAYSILGIEKYLGMADNRLRIAFFPSLTLTNNSTVTNAFVEFSPSLKEDAIVIGGKRAEGRARERVVETIDAFRKRYGITSRVRVATENIFSGGASGKGLGTSAAAGAALAHALVSAAIPEHASNSRLVALTARILAGSATRSAAGGFALWPSHVGFLSHPDDSYGIRVDDGRMDIRLVVVPIPQQSKTEDAHAAALRSPLYPKWAERKAAQVPALLRAVLERDTEAVGMHAEEDSAWLNKVIVSGGGLDNWEKGTREVQALVRGMRGRGILAYCSIDTGPSVAVITDSRDAGRVRDELLSSLPTSSVFIADIAGPPEKLGGEAAGRLLGHLEVAG